MMLTIGTTISRLNHLEYPAFEKMNQNGRMNKTTKINHMISPKGPIYIGMSVIVSCMKFLLRMLCFRHLTHRSVPVLAVSDGTAKILTEAFTFRNRLSASEKADNLGLLEHARFLPKAEEIVERLLFRMSDQTTLECIGIHSR